jgi:uncharacterized protein
LPLCWAWIQRVPAPGYALLLAGLSALGPLFAALAVAGPRRQLRDVFGRWRTPALWVVVGLFTPMAFHLGANVLEVALGGRPSQWFHPPFRPEHFAALVMFSVGEEFGWRGFAQPRMVQRYGFVAGSLLLGLVWALWHLMYSFSPEDGAFNALSLLFLLELPLYSVVIAWLFERSNRSMAVAIAVHAGAHLDNVGRIPESELRVRLLGIALVALAAVFAGRSLARRGAAQRPAP